MARRFRPAREGDMGDERMARQRRAAGRAEAGEDIDDARRKAGLMDEPGKFQKRRRPVLGGLDDERAARRQRRPELDGGQEELAVPRHDGGDDADRLAPRPDFHIGLVDRQDRAFDLVGQPRVIAVIIRDIGDLRRGLADDLSGVARFQLGQNLRILGHEIGEAVEKLTARSA